MAIDYKTPYHWQVKGFAAELQETILFLARKYLAATDTVLDIGCGDGYKTNEIASYVSRVVGIDISESGLAFAKDLSTRPVEYKVGDACQLPFGDAEFDAITAFEVIEHIKPENIARAVDEMNRVLKPGGHILLTTPNRIRVVPGKNRGDGKHYREYSFYELERLMMHRFRCLQIYGIYLYLPGFGRVKALRYIAMLLGAMLSELSWRLFYVGKKREQ